MEFPRVIKRSLFGVSFILNDLRTFPSLGFITRIPLGRSMFSYVRLLNYFSLFVKY